MTTKTDKLAIRFLYIITQLNLGEELCIKELAHRFGVTERIIQKDLNDRLSQFLPITKKDGVYFLESYLLGRLEYEDMKNFAILSGIKELYPSLEDKFLSDVLNTKVSKTMLIRGGSYEDISSISKEFELIRVAILLKHQLTLTYKEKPRVLNPYKLLNNDDIWYLIASEDGKLKTFSFTRISKLLKIEVEFKPEKEFLEIINKNELKWFSQEKIKVVLEIDAKVAEYFKRRELFTNQTILKETAKSLMLQTVVSYDEEILKVVRYWIPHVKIIEPLNLHKKLIHELESYIS